MKITARYKLQTSYAANGRGLIVTGNLLDGQVKTGDYFTFHTGAEEVTLQIADVELADCGLQFSFIYKGVQQKKALEKLQLTEQVVEIIGK